MIETANGTEARTDMTLGAPPARKARRPKDASRRGIAVRRFFTEPDTHPFDELEWEIRSAAITDENGKVIFEQTNVEMPAAWSQLATNVVVSKYFKGPVGAPQREHSLKQLIGRVADTMTHWGVEDRYFGSDEDAEAFNAELTYLLVNQYAAFNSPVWFNCGVEERPQCSACFIQSVKDDMSSIMDLAKNEVMLFKYGSGTGSNLSNIRGSKEHLAGGGIASGPVSFMKGYDSFAGVIKSGGKTRRAAKMVILNDSHPDIAEFINCKAEEEKKAWALIDAGYDGGFNVPGGAYDSIQFQNANNSVRASDAFMKAVEKDADWTTHFVTDGQPADTFRARDLMRQIADAAWVCGDPGMQFDTTINDWHTCPNTAPINASNPCCITGDTRIAVADGRNAIAIRDLAGQVVPVYAWDHTAKKTVIASMYNIGVKRRGARVFRVTLDDGSSFRATDDHLIMLRDGSYRQVKDLSAGDSLNPFHSRVRRPANARTKRRHVYTGRGWRAQYRWIWETANGGQPEGFHIHHRDFDSMNDRIENLQLLPSDEHAALHRDRMLGDNNPARRGMNAEWRANIARAVVGEKNPHFGKTHAPETRDRMRAASSERWSDPAEHTAASNRASQWMAEARADGRRIGRTPGERFERCCPACRKNFETPREEQIFCSGACRYSPLGLAMIGEKGGASRAGRPLSIAHREALRQSSKAAARPADKRRAADESLRARCLKAARLLMDAGHEVSLATWEGERETARTLGAAHVPHLASMERFFGSDADLREHAALYNHKVVSVEFDGIEDVYDGTVDGHHNFAIVTSDAPSEIAPGEPDFSGCFIHNSEYMFLDDSACNLASLNLMKFRDDEGSFDVEAFCHAVSILILAQEIIVDNASYPTAAIGKNSADYRPLGLGYANLGALLMARGVPYDSDEGRAVAGAITALMTGQAYKTSAQIAAHTGPFVGFDKNREPCLRVIKKHGDAVDTIDAGKAPEELLDAAHEVWADAYGLAGEHGIRNSQVTVLAPTGTIAFFMDCDTTGIEPDIALVKYKKLVGGGLLKIVNHTVPEALRRLGYGPEEVSNIIDYIDQNDTIEGAPGLNDAHLPVFDCAFKPANGVRSIPYMGHVRMMSAAQPFISGAISKTVNMPNTATAEEIGSVYMEGWRLGLKAIAIYRDGCKRTQPLNTSKDAGATKTALSSLGGTPLLAEAAPQRRRLPDERMSVTHKFSVAGHEGYITVGLYDDGTPGEVFITISKEGSVVSGMMDAFATAISLNLQYGVPLEVLVRKYSHMRFEPSGFTNNKQIPIAKSIVDYIFRWMALKFMPDTEQPNLPLDEEGGATAARAIASGNASLSPAAISALGSKPAGLATARDLVYQTQTDAPPCSECGTIMTRSGACYRCINCGATSGCG